jgi:hypothetical protein
MQTRHTQIPTPLAKLLAEDLRAQTTSVQHNQVVFCYGRLAIMSDVDGGGVCPECQQRKEVLLCYNEASTTERCWD